MATLFYNIRYYDEMTDKADDSGADGAKTQTLEAEMKAAISVRKRNGRVDLFNQED